MLLARRNNSDWLSNWFDDNFFNTDVIPSFNASTPAVNVKEDEKAYQMAIAAPGLKKEFCRVDIDADGNLNVKMEDKFEHRDENKKEHYLRHEFSYCNYEQSFALPENVDKEHIKAKVENGVLEIELPKLTPKEMAKDVKRIEVS